MRMSCNGCRVLRKGCTDDCTIRPCLQWIKNPESQANATVFLAKFYGRAGLINLINSGPHHLRPAIFRSLLYEACGRIVNPVHGSVGLLWSGTWPLCQAAVEAVIKGEPIAQIPSDDIASIPAPPLKACDIRHVSKDPSAHHLHKVARTRTRFKRSSTTSASKSLSREPPVELDRSHESASQATEMAALSAEEGSHVSQAEPDRGDCSEVEVGELGLELTLGMSWPVQASSCGRSEPVAEDRFEMNQWDGDACRVDLGLRLPAGHDI